MIRTRQDDLTQDTGRHRLKYMRKWRTGGHNQGWSRQSHERGNTGEGNKVSEMREDSHYKIKADMENRT